MADEDWETEIQDRRGAASKGEDEADANASFPAFQPGFQKRRNLSGRVNETSCSFSQVPGVGEKPNGEEKLMHRFGSGRTFGSRGVPGNRFEDRKCSPFERGAVNNEDRAGLGRGAMSDSVRRGGRGSFRGGRGGFGLFTNDENEKQDVRPSSGSFGFKRGGFGASGMWKSDGDSERGDCGGPKVTYVPPPPPDGEDAIFAHYQTGINFDKYDNILVEVSGLDPPSAILTFEEANLCQTLIKNIARAGYFKLTPVQKYSIPVVLAGRDLMACAQTGSGKTLSVLPENGNITWIFLLTRTCIRPVVIYGGIQMGHTIHQIMQGCNVLCATPGRLLDVINREKIGLSKLKYLVLDEADRMLDMGFGPDMKKLISSPGMPPKDQRQTLMFSATFPEEIQRVSKIIGITSSTYGREESYDKDVYNRVL
ncbi:hypothetical protein JD844_008543 [Phrynosoma platyrhinos]|uniref:RNA helicase n=1 Tax=Phrynosoma platyrhinos TaxID=52577 RepID=A0ABQ7TES2_PHRPL|nr:hypothetical protein JD844_008543 [Phrynosoma platyrhinos]